MKNTNMGKRLAELRAERNETQEVVAEAINISTEYLSKIENDKKVPSMDVTKSLAGYYDTTLDYLVYGRGKTKSNIILLAEELDARTQKLLQELVEYVVSNIKDCGKGRND